MPRNDVSFVNGEFTFFFKVERSNDCDLLCCNQADNWCGSSWLENHKD